MAPKTFDADKRATDREKAVVKVGGRTAHPARRTSKLMRDFRALGREDSKLARDQEALDEVNDGEKIEELEDQRESLTYQMLELMLVTSGDATMDAEFLREHLDIEDAGDLLNFVGPGEDADPPKPETEGSTSS